ncbi:hypothetical protein EMN47_08415 [Prolixibacteraceae bacterium JC049]|jgi:hypothetical protein|nr:hypothetical protein [Prolixibacteraceae bacterium JC049]
MKKLILTAALGCFLFMGTTFAKDFDVNRLPKYLVINAENTKLLGGIGLHINAKKSPYKEALREFEDYLYDVKKVRNMTDLLNVMDELGFDYKDSYNSSSSSIGVGDDITGSASKVRTSLIFKKMAKK